MNLPDANADEITPDLAREQLGLYAENFHRFVLEAIPRLEGSFEQETLEDLLKLARHYYDAFYLYSQFDDFLATQYLQTAKRLVNTISRLLGQTEEETD